MLEKGPVWGVGLSKVSWLRQVPECHRTVITQLVIGSPFIDRVLGTGTGRAVLNKAHLHLQQVLS